MGLISRVSSRTYRQKHSSHEPKNINKMDEATLKSLRVVDLKECLQSLNLSTKGRKAELADRLRKYYQNLEKESGEKESITEETTEETQTNIEPEPAPEVQQELIQTEPEIQEEVTEPEEIETAPVVEESINHEEEPAIILENEEPTKPMSPFEEIEDDEIAVAQQEMEDLELKTQETIEEQIEEPIQEIQDDPVEEIQEILEEDNMEEDDDNIEPYAQQVVSPPAYAVLEQEEDDDEDIQIIKAQTKVLEQEYAREQEREKQLSNLALNVAKSSSGKQIVLETVRQVEPERLQAIDDFKNGKISKYKLKKN